MRRKTTIRIPGKQPRGEGAFTSAPAAIGPVFCGMHGAEAATVTIRSISEDNRALLCYCSEIVALLQYGGSVAVDDLFV